MPDPDQRIVITTEDVAQAALPTQPGASESQLGAPVGMQIRKPAIPWWAVTLASVLTLFLPVLCLFALGVRLALRGRDQWLRAAWHGLLCMLLTVGGLLATAAWSWLWFVRSPAPAAT